MLCCFSELILRRDLVIVYLICVLNYLEESLINNIKEISLKVALHGTLLNSLSKASSFVKYILVSAFIISNGY